MALKIAPGSPAYAKLKAALEAAIAHPNMPTHAMYLARDERIHRIDRSRDLEMRYRWDLLWAGAQLIGFTPADIYTPRDNGVNDAHIDSALRHILRDIESKGVPQ